METKPEIKYIDTLNGYTIVQKDDQYIIAKMNESEPALMEYMVMTEEQYQHFRKLQGDRK